MKYFDWLIVMFDGAVLDLSWVVRGVGSSDSVNYIKVADMTKGAP